MRFRRQSVHLFNTNQENKPEIVHLNEAEICFSLAAIRFEDVFELAPPIESAMNKTSYSTLQFQAEMKKTIFVIC